MKQGQGDAGFGPHDRAVIISTGDEILTGQLQDANARWLSEQLVGAGIMPVAHAAVGDRLEDLVEVIRQAAARAPLVVMSGGLGPTDGDLTRQAMCAVTGDELVLDEGAKAALEAMLTGRGRAMNERQERQAYRPSRAVCLGNRVGTAPGLQAVVATPAAHGRADLFCLPGPPGELRPMFDENVRPRLRPPAGRTILTRLCHVVGVAEADCVQRLGDLTRRDRMPLVGVTASGGILTLRMRYEGPLSEEEAARALDEAEAQARKVLGEHLFARSDETGTTALTRAVLEDLERAGESLAVVESCTGGLLAGMLTEIPGSSRAFMGGWVTYANSMKEGLGVEPELLREHGAVSEPVARRMALQGRERSGAVWGIGITGIAGPGGGSDAKPVGTVYIAVAGPGGSAQDGGEAEVDVRRFWFSGDRRDIRQRAAVTALAMLLLGRRMGRAPRLLWEVGG